MGDGTGSGGTHGGGTGMLLVGLGVGCLVVGGWLLATRYSADYDCFEELACHADSGLSPTPADRAAAASGFGQVHVDATGDPLPGPEGTVLVVLGMILLFAAAFVGPRRRRAAEGLVGPQPMSAAYQLERYERLHARGTLSDEELEQRRARLVGPS